MKTKFVLLTLVLIASSLSAEINSGLKKFISSECNTVIGIDMKSVLSIPEINAFMNANDSKEMKQMSEMGLKPQDIQSVMIGMNSEKLASDPMAFEKQPELISISHVKDGITLDKLMTAAKSNKVDTKVEQIGGLKTVVLKKDGKEFIMAEVAPKMIAVGSRKMVSKSIALMGGASGSISDNKAIDNLISNQKGLMWLVGEKPKAKPAGADAPLDNPMTSVFGDLKMFTISMGVTEKAMTVHSDLICKDPAGADKLAMTAQLMTGLLAANEDSPVKADQIKFTKNNETVSVNIEIDKTALIKTVKAAQGLAE